MRQPISTEAKMKPRNGYKGWLCALCHHMASRSRWFGFECSKCDHQHAYWCDEYQD
jgi:hypothetical protein